MTNQSRFVIRFLFLRFSILFFCVYRVPCALASIYTNWMESNRIQSFFAFGPCCNVLFHSFFLLRLNGIIYVFFYRRWEEKKNKHWNINVIYSWKLIENNMQVIVKWSKLETIFQNGHWINYYFNIFVNDDAMSQYSNVERWTSFYDVRFFVFIIFSSSSVIL